MAERGLTPLAFKEFSNSDVDVTKTMVRLRKIEAGDKTRIEMRGVKEEVNGDKESAEKMFHLSTEWKNDFIQLWKEVENLKKVNDEISEIY